MEAMEWILQAIMGLILKELMGTVVNFPQEKELFKAQTGGYQMNRHRKKGNRSSLRVQGNCDKFDFVRSIYVSYVIHIISY